MTILEDEKQPDNPRAGGRRKFIWLILAFLVLFLLAVAWPVLQSGTLSLNNGEERSGYPTQVMNGQPFPSSPIPLSPTAAAVSPTAAAPTPFPIDIAVFSPLDQGTIILSIVDGGYAHLFTYKPQLIPLTRLTSGPWNDAHPAFSPDGTLLAFASDRDRQWDLYLMEISTGEIKRLTQSMEYEGHPSWSPDGRWLAYEALSTQDAGGLDIYVRSMVSEEEPIRLTVEASADHSPAWSPSGRQIAFVSTRSGQAEIWLADLDEAEDRFKQVSNTPEGAESHPAWRADGAQLLWISSRAGDQPQLMVWENDRPGAVPNTLHPASWAIFSPDGQAILAGYQTPNRFYLTAMDGAGAGLTLPALPLPGAVAGMTWSPQELTSNLFTVFAESVSVTPTPLWLPVLTPVEDAPLGRQQVVALSDVKAPFPMLHDMADESFLALRQRLAGEIGWDFLASLDNAFLPLTSPAGPGNLYDWKYTGRAFSFDMAPYQAGWMKIVREDFGSETYWRVFLRTRFQDGSQGVPFASLPWDINARFKGDPFAYEAGGAFETAVPEGYWFDFTELAAAYGWERLPALSSWHADYSAVRCSEFVLRDNLSWYAAMLEIYPREALNTATPLPPPSDTPLPTNTPPPSPVPTRTPPPSRTPTPTRTTRVIIGVPTLSPGVLSP